MHKSFAALVGFCLDCFPDLADEGADVEQFVAAVAEIPAGGD
jgi:hypothetical protein